MFNELNGWSNATFAARAMSLGFADEPRLRGRFSASWTSLGFAFSAFARSPRGHHLGLTAAGYEEEDGQGGQQGRQQGNRQGRRPGRRTGGGGTTLIEAVNGGASSGTPFHHGLVWATVAGVDIIGTHLSPHSSEARLRETTAIVGRLEKA